MAGRESAYINAPMGGHNIGEAMALLAGLRPRARVLGIDPGRARIGLALSDVERRLATPYRTLARGRLAATAGALRRIADDEGVGAFVCGWPLEDGHMGPAAQAARDWARAISEATGLPGAMWDETLTTQEALGTLLEADVSRARRARLVDRMAAASILQGALDAAQ